MEYYKQRIGSLIYIPMIINFVMCLFIVPASAQSTRLNLAPEFMETFDDSAAPGWDLSTDAQVAGGVLHLDQEGESAAHVDDWHNYTTLVRMRLNNSGTVGITLITSDGDVVQLVLGGGAIVARRVLPHLAVDMIVERHLPAPPELLVGEWFQLQVVQLEGMIIVGVDGERLCEVYDPTAEPLPPTGFALSAVGDTTVEVETVAVVPWVVDDFDGPLSSAWSLSEGATVPTVQQGELVVPANGYAVRTGHWEEMTFHARVRRDRLVDSALTYGGHVLTLYEDRIILSTGGGQGLQELANVSLPPFPAEPENAAWMDVAVVVRDGEHHVFAYGIELFNVADTVTAGVVSAEAFQEQLILDRLMLGWPLPLWPSPGLSGDEPDSGLSDVPSVDLAVTDLYPDQVPSGTLNVRITNNGPDTLQGAPVEITCGGTETDVSSGTGTVIPDAVQGTFNVTLGPGQTKSYPTKISLDLSSNDYDLTCTANAPLGSGAFFDPYPGNNTYTEHLAAVTPSVPNRADLGVKIAPNSQITGADVLITNHGPDALQDTRFRFVAKQVDFYESTLPHDSAFDEFGYITLGPGEVKPYWSFSFNDSCYRQEFSFDVIPEQWDPNPNNNKDSLAIGAPPHVHLIQADLAVTDISIDFDDGVYLPVYCHITNNGPDAVKDVNVRLVTEGISTSFDVTLKRDETRKYFTGVTVQYSAQYFVECTLLLLALDPDASNNSLQKIINP
jgi:hypothetical protein